MWIFEIARFACTFLFSVQSTTVGSFPREKLNVTQREENEIYGIKLQIGSEVPRDTCSREMNRRSISCISMLKRENTAVSCDYCSYYYGTRTLKNNIFSRERDREPERVPSTFWSQRTEWILRFGRFLSFFCCCKGQRHKAKASIWAARWVALWTFLSFQYEER